jgi:hypothetical protein
VAGGAHGGRASRVDGDLGGRTDAGGLPARRRRAGLTLPAIGGRLGFVDQLALLGLVGCRVPGGLVVDDLQDLDGTERGAEAAKGRELVGVDLYHAAMVPAAGLRQCVDVHQRRFDGHGELFGLPSPGEGPTSQGDAVDRGEVERSGSLRDLEKFHETLYPASSGVATTSLMTVWVSTNTCLGPRTAQTSYVTAAWAVLPLYSRPGKTLRVASRT